MKYNLGTSDIITQKQKDWLVTEKPELLGWDPDQEDFETEAILWY